MQEVLDFLNSHEIEFVLHEHPAVFTCAEAEEHCGDIPGLACKNLLLRDSKKRRYLLVLLPAEKRVDLKALSQVVGDKLSFASADDLMAKLGLEVGSVSPFGLLNDPGFKEALHAEAASTLRSAACVEVELFVDREVYEADIVSFHPNRNTATLEISHDAFLKFLDVIPHDAKILDV